MAIAHKRLVEVKLDIECYSDLDIEDLNWRELLQLDGDETVHVNIKDYHDLY